MSSFSLSLGSIKASSSLSGLELDLNAIVEFSSPLSLAYSRTGVRPVELLSSREAWVTRGIGCRISIQLRIDEERPEDEEWRADTAESLGRVLREAELWEQLDLHVALSVPSSPSATLDFDQEDIVIHIRALHRPDSEDASQQDTKLGSGSAPYINSPYGVPYVELNTLRLKLGFARGKFPVQSKRPKMEPGSSTRARFKGSSASRTLVLHCPIPRHAITWGLPSGIKSLVGGSATISQPACPLLTFSSISAQLNGGHGSQLRSAPSLSSGGIMNASNSLETLPDPTESATHNSSELTQLLALRESTGRKRHSGPDSGVNEGQMPQISSENQLQLRDMVELTDAALRSLISYRPRKTSTLRVSKEQLSPSLSAIAPALWSPGYRLAVTQRAPFIPTISRATSLIYKRCYSSMVHLKLSEFSQLPLSPAIPSSQIHLDGTDSDLPWDDERLQKLKRVLQARLWRLLQQLLYNPNAALSLKPLQMIAQNEAEGMASLGERKESESVELGSRTETPYSSEDNLSVDEMVASSETEFDEIIEGGNTGYGSMMAWTGKHPETFETENYASFADEYDESEDEISWIGEAEDYVQYSQHVSMQAFDTREEPETLDDTRQSPDPGLSRSQAEENWVFNSREFHDAPSVLDLLEGETQKYHREASEDTITLLDEGTSSLEEHLPPFYPRQYGYTEFLERVRSTEPPGSEDEIWHEHVSEEEDATFSELVEDQPVHSQDILPAFSNPDEAFLEAEVI